MKGYVIGPLLEFSRVLFRSIVTLVPLSTATVPAVMTAGSSQTLFGWRCGASGDGTTVGAKYLPGSCREIGRASCREKMYRSGDLFYVKDEGVQERGMRWKVA